MNTDELISVEKRMTQVLFDLLKEKNCKSISVSELVKKSGINRSTFYRHYKDIYDLFDKTCNAVIAETVDVQLAVPPEKSKRYIESLCRAYYEKAIENVEKISVLYEGNGEVRFLNRIRTAWCDSVFDKMKTFNLNSNRDLFLHVDKAVSYFVLKLLIPLSKSNAYIFDKFIFAFYDNYTLDYSRGLIEDMMMLQKKSGFTSNIYRSAIDFWSKTADKVAPFSIKELCQNAFISRSLFYTKYNGIYDFINEMAITGLALLSRFILDCALNDVGNTLDAFSYIRLNENLVGAFRNCLNSDDRTPFIFELYRTTHRLFLENIENTKGKDFVEQNRKELEKYIFAVAYNTVETLVSQNEGDFKIRSNSCNELREQLMF